MVRAPAENDSGTLTTGSPAATGNWDGASAATRTTRVPLIPYWPAYTTLTASYPFSISTPTLARQTVPAT